MDQNSPDALNTETQEAQITSASPQGFGVQPPQDNSSESTKPKKSLMRLFSYGFIGVIIGFFVGLAVHGLFEGSVAALAFWVVFLAFIGCGVWIARIMDSRDAKKLQKHGPDYVAKSDKFFFRNDVRTVGAVLSSMILLQLALLALTIATHVVLGEDIKSALSFFLSSIFALTLVTFVNILACWIGVHSSLKKGYISPTLSVPKVAAWTGIGYILLSIRGLSEGSVIMYALMAVVVAISTWIFTSSAKKLA